MCLLSTNAYKAQVNGCSRQTSGDNCYHTSHSNSVASEEIPPGPRPPIAHPVPSKHPVARSLPFGEQACGFPRHDLREMQGRPGVCQEKPSNGWFPLRGLGSFPHPLSTSEMIFRQRIFMPKKKYWIEHFDRQCACSCLWMENQKLVQRHKCYFCELAYSQNVHHRVAN